MNTLNFMFYISEMIIVGYAIGIATLSGDIIKDQEGVEDLKILGNNIGWLMNRIGPNEK